MTEPLPEISLVRNNGAADSLANYRGKVLLIVNTASKCGLTPQYAGLEKLRSTYAGRGFEVLGFPANDFAGQEPGNDAEIAQFCDVNFNASFPLFQKASVVGSDKQPLFAALTSAVSEKTGDTDSFKERLRSNGLTPNEDPEVLWNFEKFLIARDGRVLARFSPTTAPEDAALAEAIESALEA
ncbi:glutathione peroxidase [Croceicoccus sp. F390]|uniref:Glutathione peroxidase n=1 Tax=Croceicoccus esteveae TaxID=3075597 RepID=A0ABU2ZIX0_9SPHN|nr:glutathione peroxidase [Croceicoccus sp. F390]MDT0576244.1 glutathione peroxidase [Croceicoccus sp. F390]